MLSKKITNMLLCGLVALPTLFSTDQIANASIAIEDPDLRISAGEMTTIDIAISEADKRNGVMIPSYQPGPIEEMEFNKAFVQMLRDLLGDEKAKMFLMYYMDNANLPYAITQADGTDLDFDLDSFISYGASAYGKPRHVRGNDTKPKDRFGKTSTQYRYIGYTASGTPFNNYYFPDDVNGENNMATRNWVIEPWNKAEGGLNSQIMAKKTDPMWESQSLKEAWLSGILDPHIGDGNTRGGFGAFTNEQLVSFAQIEQAPTAISPGQVTMWHRRYYPNSNPITADGFTWTPKCGYDEKTGSNKCWYDWYESFLLAPNSASPYAPGVMDVWDNLRITNAWTTPSSPQSPGTKGIIWANVEALMPRLNDPKIQDLMNSLGINTLTYDVVNGEAEVKANVYLMLDSTQTIIDHQEITLQKDKPQTVGFNIRYPLVDSKVHIIITHDPIKSPNFKEWFPYDNIATLDLQVAAGPSCMCEGEGNIDLDYDSSAKEYLIQLGTKANLMGVDSKDIDHWTLYAKDAKSDMLFEGMPKEVATTNTSIDEKYNISIPADMLEFDSSGQAIVKIVTRARPYLNTIINGSNYIDSTSTCDYTVTIKNGPANKTGTGTPTHIPIPGGGLDNIKINALIPDPNTGGNGGKPGGAPVAYKIVAQAELPSDYVSMDISYNAGKSRMTTKVYPRTSQVAGYMNTINSYQGTTVDGSGKINISMTVPSWGCTYMRYGSCENWVRINIANPDYSKAVSTAQDLVNYINNRINIVTTITLQDQTCSVTLVRNEKEQACTINGEMPYWESEVEAVAVGKDIVESNTDDNVRAIMMYPIQNKAPIDSVRQVTSYNMDPNNAGNAGNANGVKNAVTEPAKYGQQIRVKVASTPGTETVENLYGYDIQRLYSYYANTSYSENIPTGGTFVSSGNTPSAINGVSPQAGNKTWDNDFTVTSKGGSDIVYLHKVTREQQSYGSDWWYDYKTYWANANSSKAEVETEWTTTARTHWIVDLIKNDNTSVGYWPEHGTIPPLKNGVPTPISQGGSPQQVQFNIRFLDRFGDLGTVDIAPLQMFGTLSTVIN